MKAKELIDKLKDFPDADIVLQTKTFDGDIIITSAKKVRQTTIGDKDRFVLINDKVPVRIKKRWYE